jgi:hypothetical protein
MHGGVAKRPDLNEVDVPEWAEPALYTVERSGLLQRIRNRVMACTTRRPKYS